MSNYKFFENKDKYEYEYGNPEDDIKKIKKEKKPKIIVNGKKIPHKKEESSSSESEQEENAKKTNFTSNWHNDLPCPVPKPFDPKNETPKIEPEMTMVINGKRRTGKTYLATMLLFMIRSFYPVVFVFTDTKMNCWYNQYINPDYIYNGYDETILRKILQKQRERVFKWRNKDRNFNPYILIVWDDCVPQNMFQDPLFRDIYFKGRHYFICNIMTTQYYYLIPKNLRGNIDLVFSLVQDMKHQIEAIWDDVIGRRCNLQEFTQMFDKYTKDRGFLCFDQSNSQIPITERVYYGKAFDPGIFFLGCQEVWKNNINHLRSILLGSERVKARRKPSVEHIPIYSEKDIEKINPNPYSLDLNLTPITYNVRADVSSAAPVQVASRHRRRTSVRPQRDFVK